MPFIGRYTITELGSSLLLEWGEQDDLTGQLTRCSLMLENREWIHPRHRSAGRSLSQAFDSCVDEHDTDVTRLHPGARTGPEECAGLFRLLHTHSDAFFAHPDRSVTDFWPFDWYCDGSFESELACFCEAYARFIARKRPTDAPMIESVCTASVGRLVGDMASRNIWPENMGQTQDGYDFYE